jgi:hypothetical protein
MSDHALAVDTLADTLLAAINDFPVDRPFSRDPTRGEPERRLAKAYNRLYCELHDKEPSQEWLDAQHDPKHPLYGKSWAAAIEDEAWEKRSRER